MAGRHAPTLHYSTLSMQPTSQAFLVQLSRSAAAVEASIADNCRFDERAAGERWAKFEEKLPETDPISLDDWAEANKLNYENSIIAVSLSVPDTFLAINQPAWLTGLIDNRTLVRLECLQSPLFDSSLSFDELQGLLVRAKAGEVDAANSVKNFVETWNKQRDARPAFATFYDEVKNEADDADWPHALRDRLGIGHYGRDGGAPLAVALMRYTLPEVLAAQIDRKLPAAYALPTVLDGGMHEFFFPAPKGHPFGATLHLDADKADWLTAEILHRRIEYKPEHLWKIGWINRAHRVKDVVLRESRDLHLYALRDACKRDDFGEEMLGRT
ncbi:MAG: hypothetical protein WCI11_13050 [Candidatus Methylumidiphilus sp.]